MGEAMEGARQGGAGGRDERRAGEVTAGGGEGRYGPGAGAGGAPDRIWPFPPPPVALALAVVARARARGRVLVRGSIHDHAVGRGEQLGLPLEQILAPRAIRVFG